MGSLADFASPRCHGGRTACAVLGYMHRVAGGGKLALSRLMQTQGEWDCFEACLLDFACTLMWISLPHDPIPDGDGDKRLFTPRRALAIEGVSPPPMLLGK